MALAHTVVEPLRLPEPLREGLTVNVPLFEPAVDAVIVGDGEPLMQPQNMAKPSSPGRAFVPLRLSW